MLIEHMKRTFAERSRRNPSYSLRAFSRSLGMDSSTVSALLSGKRPLTMKTARRLIDGLNITDPQEAQALIVESFAAPATNPVAEYQELAIEAAETIASWEHFAILALLELKDFSGQERAISERLNIPIGIVMECLSRLDRLGLVNRKDRMWKLTGKNMTKSPATPSGALREGHRQNIMKSLRSLDEDPIEVRDISGITMAVSKERLPGARKMIQEFRRRLSAYLEGGKKNSVYRLNVQLFPLMKETGE